VEVVINAGLPHARLGGKTRTAEMTASWLAACKGELR